MVGRSIKIKQMKGKKTAWAQKHRLLLEQCLRFAGLGPDNPSPYDLCSPPRFYGRPERQSHSPMGAVSWPVAGSVHVAREGRVGWGSPGASVLSIFLLSPPSFGLQALILPVLCRKCSAPLSTLYSRARLVSCSPGVVTPLLLVQQLSTICRRTNTPASTILSAQADLQCQLRSSSPSSHQGAATVESEHIPNPCWSLPTLAPFAWRGKTKVWSGAWTLEPGCLCPDSRASILAVLGQVPSPLCSSVSHLPNGLPFGFS